MQPEISMTRTERDKILKAAEAKKIGSKKIRTPTKTGSRNTREQQTRETRRESEKKAFLNEGKFFYRYWPRFVEHVRIAKILNGGLWLRNDHRDTNDFYCYWAKAETVNASRLNQEIKTIGKYLEKRQICQESAEELLDLLYALLEKKL